MRIDCSFSMHGLPLETFETDTYATLASYMTQKINVYAPWTKKKKVTVNSVEEAMRKGTLDSSGRVNLKFKGGLHFCVAGVSIPL